ncbi:MAG: glycosyltransferase family 2 protein [Candidatus Curtissbacteria bacterium]|nr:glycosyltransferase family 2 protein [Candidatus Curtissbacteria bacterium]
MKKIQISAALATFNEEKNVADCINSLKSFADEIIVVDGSSSDKTRELAQKLGAKVFKTTNKQMFHINKNMAIDKTAGPWIFLIDADERVSSALAREIKDKVKSSPNENGFWVNRRNWFIGKFLEKGGAYPDSVIRLFKKGKGRLPQISVHEQVKIDGKVGRLKNDILHLADPDFARYLMRADRYTAQTAREIANLNPGFGLGTILKYTVFKPIYTFILIYFRHLGFKDGFPGFVWAFFSGAHHFYAYIKYWEIAGKSTKK